MVHSTPKSKAESKPAATKSAIAKTVHATTAPKFDVKKFKLELQVSFKKFDTFMELKARPALEAQDMFAKFATMTTVKTSTTTTTTTILARRPSA
jgi:hypothetical protein